MARPSPRCSHNHVDTEVLSPVGETSACFFLFICLKFCVSLNRICTSPPPAQTAKWSGYVSLKLVLKDFFKRFLAQASNARRACEDRVSPQSRSPYSLSFQYPFCLIASRFLELRAVFQPRDSLSTKPPTPHGKCKQRGGFKQRLQYFFLSFLILNNFCKSNLVHVAVNFLSQVIFVFLLFFGYGNVC